MYRILTCVTAEHDYRLVGLAVLVCMATTGTAFVMYSIACANRDRRRLGWAALTGVCAGAGIWATHFVAMLAYRETLPIFFEPVTTLVSLLVATAIAACGFALSAGGGKWLVPLGGLLIGTAIGAMHYTGMRALIVPGDLIWDRSLVVASLALGMAFATAAMVAFHSNAGRSAIVWAGALLPWRFALCISPPWAH